MSLAGRSKNLLLKDQRKSFTAGSKKVSYWRIKKIKDQKNSLAGGLKKISYWRIKNGFSLKDPKCTKNVL